jgi:hypothetical protein
MVDLRKVFEPAATPRPASIIRGSAGEHELRTTKLYDRTKERLTRDEIERIVMYAKAPYTVMQHAMHIHPTVSELLPTILGDLKSVG